MCWIGAFPTDARGPGQGQVLFALDCLPVKLAGPNGSGFFCVPRQVERCGIYKLWNTCGPPHGA